MLPLWYHCHPLETIDQKVWDQMKLPIAQSGLGLGYLEDTAKAAFISSIVGVKDSIERVYPSFQLHLANDEINQDIPTICAIKEAVNYMRNKIPTLSCGNVLAQLPDADKSLQATFVSKMLSGKLEEYMGNIIDKNKIVMTEAHIDDNAGAWMTVIPKWEHLIISNAQMAVIWRMRFHLFQTISPSGVCCDCAGFQREQKKYPILEVFV